MRFAACLLLLASLSACSHGGGARCSSFSVTTYPVSNGFTRCRVSESAEATPEPTEQDIEDWKKRNGV